MRVAHIGMCVSDNVFVNAFVSFLCSLASLTLTVSMYISIYNILRLSRRICVYRILNIAFYWLQYCVLRSMNMNSIVDLAVVDS